MEFMSSLQGGVDELKPSLFELLSEQQLSDLLPPSLRYLLALATQRHPRYLIRILNNFDEAYALLSLLLERHFLRNYGGTFTENFYGLKRERVLRIAGGEVPRAQLGAPREVRETLRLRDSDIWRNLLVAVGLPYIKRKLDEAYDVHVPAQATVLGPTFARQQSLPANPTLRQRFDFYYKLFLRRAYPSVNAAYYMSLLAFNLAYLFDGSKFHHPFLWLIGSRVRRQGEADFRAMAEAAKAASTPKGGARPGQGGSIFHPRVFVQTLLPKLLSSLRFLLPTSIFALKFLEWWHASDFARQLSRKATEGLELPPPIIAGSTSGAGPVKSKEKSGSPRSSLKDSTASLSRPKAPVSTTSGLPILTVAPPSDSSLCPICLQQVQTATATPYGHVFCYTCIHRWVEGTSERQERFMTGDATEEETAWAGVEARQDSTSGHDDDEKEHHNNSANAQRVSRQGQWESGAGRCAVTGRRILGGTEGLRRIMV